MRLVLVLLVLGLRVRGAGAQNLLILQSPDARLDYALELAKLRPDTLTAALLLDSQIGPADSPSGDTLTPLAHYQAHRYWAGFNELRRLAETHPAATSAFVLPLVRGLLGWETDAGRRAAALEPHMPPEWNSFKAANLRVGRDRLEAVMTRAAGIYSISLHRLTRGPPLFLRIAPALPLGAHVERIVVNDHDVEVQSEESAHDLHGLAEVRLSADAEIDFYYSGGLEVVTPVSDVNREGRDYIVTVEGLPNARYPVQLRTEARVRAIIGSDAFEQLHTRVNARVTMPPGIGTVRRRLRVRF